MAGVFFGPDRGQLGARSAAEMKISAEAVGEFMKSKFFVRQAGFGRR
jgi:hypothetical protein